MWEPDLPSDHFVRDHVLSRERVIDADAWASVQASERVGDFFKIEDLGKASFRCRIYRTDLSLFNGLSLVAGNHTQSPLLVGIKLVHGPDRDPPNVSLSGGRELLNPGEQRELKFPREAFGTYGFRVGWAHMQEVEVSFTVERGNPAPASIRVSMGPLEGLVREIPTGPRLSRKGLGGLLIKDVPGVTSFFGGPVDDATNSPASGPNKSLGSPYFRGSPGLFVPPPHPYPKESAEQILDGQVMGQRIGYPVDWDANPLGELEWRHFLHRQHFLRELIRESLNTGDAHYIKALDSVISSWIHANPVPVGSNGGAGPSWETLSAAWRLREWLWVIGIAWPNESFQQKTKLDMLCSVWEHVRSLMDHRGHPNNWIIVESAALVLAGLCFPEFKEASQWVKTGLQRLRDEFRRQFFSDGAHFEISPLYHAICVHALLEVKQAAAAKGIKLPQEFHSPLEKCFEYLVGLSRPDFTWPSLNDSGGVTGDYTALMSLAGTVFHRPDFDWIGSRGASGVPPTAISRFFPDAGIAAMRSDHGRDSNFLVFRAGPPGASHIHNDCLSLDVTALGGPMLVDPGITSYAPGPMTDYYRSASAHNVVLIDGKGPDRSGMAFHEKIRPVGEDFYWERLDDLEIATGVSKGGWKATGIAQSGGGTRFDPDYVLVRTVVFVRREYWIVRDIVAGNGAHEITACWQFSAGPLEIDLNLKNRAAVRLDARGPGFELIPLLGRETVYVETATGSLQPPSGWISMNGTNVPATTCRYSMRETLPMTLIWLLLPLSDWQRVGATGKRTDRAEGDVLVEVATPGGRKDVLTFPHPLKVGTEIIARRLHDGIRIGADLQG